MHASEYGQSKWLAENVFSGKTGGVFAECGALDGLQDSNSLYFEHDMAWTGLLIEANPRMLLPLAKNRPNCFKRICALSDQEGEAEFFMVPGIYYGWSGLARYPGVRRPGMRMEPVTVPCETLESVMLDYGMDHCDYLSIDLEGAEYDVLRVFPFDKIHIDVIGVEDNTNNNLALSELLTGAGYTYLNRVGVDNFWRKSGGRHS